MASLQGKFFDDVGRQCIEFDGETLEDVAARTIVDLRTQYDILEVRAGIDAIVNSPQTDAQLDKSWQHTGARIWFHYGTTRNYFRMLQSLAAPRDRSLPHKGERSSHDKSRR